LATVQIFRIRIRDFPQKTRSQSANKMQIARGRNVIIAPLSRVINAMFFDCIDRRHLRKYLSFYFFVTSLSSYTST